MLKRQKNAMPAFIRKALEDRGVLFNYKNRPAYQQNDYLGWIMRAKQEKTRQKRLQQMLDELRNGGIYMKMEHAASKKYTQ